MTLALAHRLRWLASAIAVAASAAIVLMFVAREYGARSVLPSWTAGLPVAAPGAAPGAAPSSRAANPLELSLFAEPRELPKIRFTDAQSHALTLADFRGRVVLLNIWATWCVPCRKEMPALDRLEAALGGADFLVIPLSIDRGGLPAVQRFYKELGLQKLEIYLDSSGAASRALGVLGVPTTLLADRDGREVARKMGPAKWDAPEMVALIRRQIDAPAASATKARP